MVKIKHKKYYWKFLGRSEHIIAKLIFLCIFIVPIIDTALAYEKLYTSYFLNRATHIFIIILSIPFSLQVVDYYRKNIKLVDIFLALFVAFYLYSCYIHGSYYASNIARLIVCFYLVSYFMRYLGSVAKAWYLVLLCVGVFEMWLVIRLPSTLEGGRLTFVGTANTSARILVAAFALLLFIIVNRNIYEKLIRRIAQIQALVAIALTFATGSRQGLILGVLMMVVLAWFFRGEISIRHVLKRSGQTVALVVFGYALVYAAVLTIGGDDYTRFFRFSPKENLSRVGRYLVYYHWALDNLETIFVYGVGDISSIFGASEEVTRFQGIKLGAAHNVLLQVGLQRGLLTLFSYFLFHAYIFKSMVRVHNWTGGKKTSAAAIAIAVSALLVALVSNYFNQVSSPLSYLFYVIAGIYCNAERDLTT